MSGVDVDQDISCEVFTLEPLSDPSQAGRRENRQAGPETDRGAHRAFGFCASGGQKVGVAPRASNIDTARGAHHTQQASAAQVRRGCGNRPPTGFAACTPRPRRRRRAPLPAARARTGSTAAQRCHAAGWPARYTRLTSREQSRQRPVPIRRGGRLPQCGRADHRPQGESRSASRERVLGRDLCGGQQLVAAGALSLVER
ncbi:MAG: hypothetical protein QOE87_2647 [Gaiellales bacterium]|nr:hypothetical protein [Gaiellales bacterium]